MKASCFPLSFHYKRGGKREDRCKIGHSHLTETLSFEEDATVRQNTPYFCEKQRKKWFFKRKISSKLSKLECVGKTSTQKRTCVNFIKMSQSLSSRPSSRSCWPSWANSTGWTAPGWLQKVLQLLQDRQLFLSFLRFSLLVRYDVTPRPITFVLRKNGTIATLWARNLSPWLSCTHMIQLTSDGCYDGPKKHLIHFKTFSKYFGQTGKVIDIE